MDKMKAQGAQLVRKVTGTFSRPGGQAVSGRNNSVSRSVDRSVANKDGVAGNNNVVKQSDNSQGKQSQGDNSRIVNNNQQIQNITVIQAPEYNFQPEARRPPDRQEQPEKLEAGGIRSFQIEHEQGGDKRTISITQSAPGQVQATTSLASGKPGLEYQGTFDDFGNLRLSNYDDSKNLVKTLSASFPGGEMKVGQTVPLFIAFPHRQTIFPKCNTHKCKYVKTNTQVLRDVQYGGVEPCRKCKKYLDEEQWFWKCPKCAANSGNGICNKQSCRPNDVFEEKSTARVAFVK